MPQEQDTVLCLPQYHPIHQQGRADCQTAIAICVLQYFCRLQRSLSNGWEMDAATSERVKHLLEKAEVECPREFRDRFLSHHHRVFSPNDPLPMNVFGRLVSPLQFACRRHGEHTGFPPSVVAIQGEIQNGRPLVLILKSVKVSQPHHFVSLVGWLKQGVAHNLGEDVAVIHDPLKEQRSTDEINISQLVLERCHKAEREWLERHQNSLRLIRHSVLDDSSKPNFTTIHDAAHEFPWRWTATLMFKHSLEQLQQIAPTATGKVTSNSKVPLLAGIDTRSELESKHMAAMLWKHLEWHERANSPLLCETAHGTPMWKKEVTILYLPVVTTLATEASFGSSRKGSGWGTWLSQTGDLRWQEGHSLFMAFPWFQSGHEWNASPYVFRLSQDRNLANNYPSQIQRSKIAFGIADVLLRTARLQTNSLIVMHAKTGSHLLLSCPEAQPMPYRPTHEQVQKWCLRNERHTWQASYISMEQTAPTSIPDLSEVPKQFERFYKLRLSNGGTSSETP